MYQTFQRAIAAWAFNHYIAFYYFDNVNIDQLNVAFEKGEVELVNLPIKKSALSSLNLPLDVESGIVGTLSIKVPLLSLLTEPWLIKVSNLLLTVSPPKKTFDCSLNSEVDACDNESQLDYLNESASAEEFAKYLDPKTDGAKYAEFFSGFSETVSSVVRDVYKNIKIEIDSATLLFDDFEFGLHRLNIEHLVLQRVKTVKNLDISNISLILSPTNDSHVENSIIIERCNIDIFDDIELETRIEGILKNTFVSQTNGNTIKKDILNCDLLKFEFKLNDNNEESSEKNVYTKIDFRGMRYFHSDRTCRVFLTLLLAFRRQKSRFFIKKQTNQKSHGYNSLMVINIEHGLVYLTDDHWGPLLEFIIEDCRIWQFTDKTQRNGFIFTKFGSNYYDRETSSWDVLLKPWPLNLSWDVKTCDTEKKRNLKVCLNSDESAEFYLTSSFLDIYEISLKKIVEKAFEPKLWKINLDSSMNSLQRLPMIDLNSIFVISNETGYRLFFAQIEDNFEINDDVSLSSHDDDTYGRKSNCQDSTTTDSSSNTKESQDNCYTWTAVDVGKSASFDFTTSPIFRRYNSECMRHPRELAIRVDGWKTLAPVNIDKTGIFCREAWSDRIMNEDTHIVVSIKLDENSSRKIISVKSPLNLVNNMNETLEVHFAESNQAIYLKPNNQMSVPLPFLSNRIHLRPCNAGVTMTDKALSWDKIKAIKEDDSRLLMCRPITVTDLKHASYCTSLPYRICVSTRRLFQNQASDDLSDDDILGNTIVPIYEINFFPPLEFMNLLPVRLDYQICGMNGEIPLGTYKLIHHVDTTKPVEIFITMKGFVRSKSIKLIPGATGSFRQTLEMIDSKNRTLYLNAKIVLVSYGEVPALKVIISAPYWFINKTNLPLIFKQEGAALECAGQQRDNEDLPKSPLMFSFYENEFEPPLLCCMRLGRSKGVSIWCDGFKLEKGSGQRKITALPGSNSEDQRAFKALIDIDIRKGSNLLSDTLMVTFTTRYGFDPFLKTPKKISMPSPQNYKLTSYNQNANLADRIADQAVNLFGKKKHDIADIDITTPGFSLSLINNQREHLIKASATNLNIKSITKRRDQLLSLTVQSIKVSNMLPESEKNIILDQTTKGTSKNEAPALKVIMDRVLANRFGTTFFRQVQISACDFVLNLEEKLILKVIEFVTSRKRKSSGRKSLASDMDKILNPEDIRKTMYYFNLLRIDLSSVKLSIFTSPHISESLQKLKSYLSIKMLGFEDAEVNLNPYLKMNVSKTFKNVFESVTQFYKSQIMEQAPRIVGQQIQNYLRFHLPELLSSIYDEVYRLFT